MAGDFRERLNFGKKAEKIVAEYFTKYGFAVELQEVVDEQTRNQNLVWGDIILENFVLGKNLHFDVKATTFISETSIVGFRGEYYILYPVKPDGIHPEDVPSSKIIRAKTIQRYWQQIPAAGRMHGPSGDLGYYFKNVKNYITLEEFMTLLVKIILVHPQETHQFYIDLNHPFNKVLPKGAA
jgi:hypothetical protein